MRDDGNQETITSFSRQLSQHTFDHYAARCRFRRCSVDLQVVPECNFVPEENIFSSFFLKAITQDD